MLPTSCQCKVTLGPETIEIIEITTIPIISIIQWSWLGGLWTEGLGWARLGSSAGLETPLALSVSLILLDKKTHERRADKR